MPSQHDWHFPKNEHRAATALPPAAPARAQAISAVFRQDRFNLPTG
jgi:hypothetical protein